MFNRLGRGEIGAVERCVATSGMSTASRQRSTKGNKAAGETAWAIWAVVDIHAAIDGVESKVLDSLDSLACK